MIYLDYSATTPVKKEVLDYFNECTTRYVANPNSFHSLGKEAKKFIEKASENILKKFNLNNYEIIYTSGASEANNLAVKGIANKYKNKGKHIITTSLEHPSITAPISYLQKKGFQIDIVKINKYGLVDLKHLKSLIKDNTILVSIGAVSSELGMLQPINEIAKILKKHPQIYFHSDVTQAVGKVKLDYNNIDLLTFSAHKFFGLKGVGALVKRKDIKLETQIHGGSSTTPYRSGTPSLPLIASLDKAIELAFLNLDEKYEYVKELKDYLKEKLKKIKEIRFNSNEYSIPHILNISILNVLSKETVKELEKKGIYISSYTACASDKDKSFVVFYLRKDLNLASSSVRISLSYKTNKQELDELIKVLKEVKK